MSRDIRLFLEDMQMACEKVIRYVTVIIKCLFYIFSIEINKKYYGV
jgi:hypothetical protein